MRDPARYELLGEHGRGALGRVTRARDLELGRDVAIKELISRDHASEARFLREALITARLEHPGIVAVHEAGRWPDGTPFYAMKLVSGRPLRTLIAERDTVAERIGLLHHVIAVADAIAYAHGRNVIHRDLKPSNIIVGDFGETVVIDWGLAKDLTADDEPAASGIRARGTVSRELTAIGTVLGTPAYMAPEQERGEPVDQRADVYAIGVMLWELCAASYVIPDEARARDRELRGTGIDHDLAAIISKAIDPAPARRYRDAGALATDLRAFKSGARIAAREYSLAAVVAHWVRHHRALAGGAILATAIALLGVSLYVHGIAAERDRAQLEHAEVLIHSDPTAALAALTSYRGSDTVRAQRLRAEAEGRGVAREVLTPHSVTVWFAAGDETGAVISLGEDRRIQLTQGGVSTTLATDVSTQMRVTFAPERRLLAYATAPSGIGLLDLRTQTTRRIPGRKPAVIELSRDGARLAVAEPDGRLEVWTTDAAPAQIYTGMLPAVSQLRFATATRIIALAGGRLHALDLDLDLDRAAPVAPVVIQDLDAPANIVDLDATSTSVLAGTEDGKAVLLTAALEVRATAPLCRQRMRIVRFIPQTDQLAFSCQDPLAGIARYTATLDAVTVIDRFATQGSTPVRPDASGRYVGATDESNTGYLYDLATRRMTRYDGNAGRPTFVAAPTAAFPHVLIGDVNGTVRVWDPPDRAARVAVHAAAAAVGLAFPPGGTWVFAGSADGVVRRIGLDDATVVELRGHTALATTRAAPDGSSVLSFGRDGSARTWDPRDGRGLRVFTDHAGVVSDAEYIEHGRRVVSVGDDGRLLAWSPAGRDVAVWLAHDGPLTGVEVLPQSDHAVVKDARGGVWDVSPAGAVTTVRAAGGPDVTIMVASPRGDHLALGTAAGELTVYATSTWGVIATLRTEGGIRAVSFDPRGRDLMVASKGRRSQFGHVAIVALDGPPRLGWSNVAVEATDVAYAPDGETLGFACADGGAWLYAAAVDRWAYARDHETEVLSLRFSPDGHQIVTGDRRGVITLRDVAATFAH